MGIIAAAYGLVCYAVFLASFLYSIGFVRHPIMLEERDLVRYIGPEYEAYRRKVPMLIPTGSRRG